MRLRTAAITLIAAATLATSGVAYAAVRIDAIYFDPPGSDTGGNLNQEYVVVKNTGARRVRLRGWKLRDLANHVFRFPRVVLRPGKVIRIHTGSGQDDRNDLFWDSGWYIWNNDGDKATLKRRTGRTVDTCRYGADEPSPADC